MTDRRVRELERRFRETHSVDDEAAWLRELIRIGELSGDGMELLVYVGHPAARVVSEADPTGPEELPEWVKGLNGWGKEASLRAAIAVARTIHSERKNVLGWRAEQVFALAERRLANPKGEDLPLEYHGANSLGWHLCKTANAKGTFSASIAAMRVAESGIYAELDADVLRRAVADALVAWILEPASRVVADRWAEEQARESAERHKNLEERAAELRRRVAQGELAPVRLELAAHLGHWPACRALNRPLRGDSDRWVTDWLTTLADYGLEPLLLGARALDKVPGYVPVGAERSGTEAWARKRILQLDENVVSSGDVRRAVRQAVLPWALGE